MNAMTKKHKGTPNKREYWKRKKREQRAKEKAKKKEKQ
jgi:hypothetical protein